MKKGRIGHFFTLNYDLVIGLLFFLGYRLFFTWLLWHGRTVPPEPDDSYFYLASAKHFLNANTFEEFRLLPFSLWLNFLSMFTHSNLETAYKLNFYAGPIIMFAAIYYFTRILENNRLVRLLLLMVIALYSGSGDYHGFYWVVESFYQLALFMIIFAFLINQGKTSLYKIFPICFLFIFIHPTSAFLSTIFILYPFVLLLFSKKEALKALSNLLSVFTSLIISIALYVVVGRIFPSANSNESFQTQLGLIKDFFSGKLNFVSFPIIWREYFAIFFNNFLTTITFFVMFIFVFYLKNYKLLAIYFSILIIVFLSSFVPYGSRTLGFLWPITFFIIGYFLVGIWRVLSSITPKFKLAYLTIIPFVGLFSLATIFNMISITSVNATKNYSWDRACALRSSNENTYFTSKESMNAFLLYQDSESNSRFLSQDEINNFLNENNLLVTTKNENLQPPALSGVEQNLASNITRKGKIINIHYPQNAWITPSVDPDTLQKSLNTSNLTIAWYQDCGHFQVSKVKRL